MLRNPRLDVVVALGLAVAGALEVLLLPGFDGRPGVAAVAAVAAALPLAWRRRAPLLPLAAIAAVLLLQAPLDGGLVGDTVTPLIALLIALYTAGRHTDGVRELAFAGVAIAVVVATRAGLDPAVESVADVALTLVAVTLPLLVGRWVRGQAALQRELETSAARLERDRERDARQAAEEERMRIAADLQAAAAGGLRTVAERAPDLRARLLAGDHGAARALNTEIGDTAREALADVRRVLGVLRHDGSPPRLAPPAAPAAPMRAGGEAVGTAADPASVSPPEEHRMDPRIIDRLLAAAVAIGGALQLAILGEPPAALLTAIPIAAPLLLRRRHPLPVALATLAAIALQSLLLDLGSFPFADMAAVTCAAYAIGAYTERRPAVAGLALTAGAAAAHAALFYPPGVVPALLGGVLAPWTIGRIVRANRALTRENRDETVRVAARHEREGRAAVTAERMRVARELHDAVAHNVSVIAIQAAGVEGIVERDPERAARCADLIESVAAEALQELGRLSVAPGDVSAPQPSLAGVEALADRAREGGLPVELHVEGDPAPLPAGVDLAGFRIVQEALANAAKHARGAAASVVVRYGERALELEVTDDGAGPAKPSAPASGHGLVGMRERVALYDGELSAGPAPGGGFAVKARLPR